MDIKSLCIHGNDTKYDQTGAISVPIFQSATFAHPGVGETTGYDYSRLSNPTRDHLERTLASLEQGTDALAFSSGMAAIACVMELFEPGDHVIASDDLYGGTHRLFTHISKKNGIVVDRINTSSITSIEEGILDRTKAIFIETPTNPMMKVTDIKKVAALAKRHKLLLVVDNTFLTPYFQKPLLLGADVVIHSGTKYLGGHNDTLAGFLVVKDADVSEKLRFIYKTTGACLSPFDSWLMIRGIKTLSVRMDRQQENAIAVANWMSGQEKIRKVYYAGLPSHPDYELSLRQGSGFGAMISFEVDSKETAEKILSRLKMIQYAESLGGVESLITYPFLQTHADIPADERESIGITQTLLRLSVGIESIDDLLNDFAQALKEE